MHIMMELEHKQQEKGEMDKMRKEKLKEAQERREEKEMEERLSLAETKEQILKLQEKLRALQEEKHLFCLQLKKVVDEEEKWRQKEQNDLTALTSAADTQELIASACRGAQERSIFLRNLIALEPNRCSHLR